MLLNSRGDADGVVQHPEGQRSRAPHLYPPLSLTLEVNLNKCRWDSVSYSYPVDDGVCHQNANRRYGESTVREDEPQEDELERLRHLSDVTEGFVPSRNVMSHRNVQLHVSI